MHQPLQEAFYESDRARLLRWVPWLHLFRALRLATRWQNLVLALLGLFLLAAGRWGVSHFPFSAYSRQIAPPVPRLLQERDFSAHIENRTQWPWEANFLANELHSPRAVLRQPHAIAPQTILTPLRDLLSPASVLFQRRNTWSDIADAWLNILLVLAVGAVVGGAITRRVALEFGRSIEPGLVEALRFSVRDFPFYFGAPFISVVGIGLLLLLGRIIGWIGLIPGFGETLAAFAWGPLLILALVMALILLGVAVSWPLMVAAHSAEGTDGFDALNRAYNYVFVRPWYALWMLVVSLVYGAVALVFVLFLVGLTLHLSEWMAAGPLSDEALARVTLGAPPLVEPTGLPGVEPNFASRVGGVWLRGLAGLLNAFVYSFFWTSATLVYLLLRQSNDACELNRIYLPSPPPASDGPPLAGMAAVKNRELDSAATDVGLPTSADASPSE